MKTIYTCEKCGRQFEDYSECSKHESSHLVPEEISTWSDLPYDKFDSLGVHEFDADDLRPCAIWVKFHQQTDDGSYRYDDNGDALYTAARYVLDTTRKTAPKAEQILEAMRARRAELHAAREEECERRAAEKEAADAE